MTMALRVLIMIQDPLIQSSMSLCVENAEHVPEVAENADQAVAALARASFDVLLWMPGSDLDVHIPDLCARYPALYVIALLPTEQFPALASRALASGAWDCLAYPMADMVLEAALRRAASVLVGQRAELALTAQRREIDVLYRATVAIASSLDPDQVLTEILLETRRVLRTESASVLLLDEKSTNLYFLATSGGASRLEGLQVPTGCGIASWSVREGQVAIVNDVSTDPRFYRGIDEISGYRTRNLLAAPLSVRGKIIGAIEAVNRTDRAFAPDDVPLIESLALTAAAAIQNSLVYKDLEASRDLLEAVLDSASNGMAAVDDKGNALFHNPATERLFGIKHDSGRAINLGRFVERYAELITVLHPAGKTWQDYRGAIVSATAPQYFILQLDFDKPIILDSVITPMPGRGDSGPTRLLSWRDVTNEREMEQWREDLTHIIVHDLRNPLSLVRVGIEASQMFLPPDTNPDVLQGLTLALQGVTQLERKTDVLLAVNELEAGRRIIDTSAIALGELVAAVQAFYQFEADERHVALEAELGEVPVVQGDRDMVEWCVGNLVHYAMKHSSRPGRIRITAHSDQAGVTLSIDNENAFIPPEDREHLFAKYFQPQGQHYTSTPGVGLYFCQLAIAAHQGNISLVSGAEKGYRFDIWLPRA